MVKKHIFSSLQKEIMNPQTVGLIVCVCVLCWKLFIPKFYRHNIPSLEHVENSNKNRIRTFHKDQLAEWLPQPMGIYG